MRTRLNCTFLAASLFVTGVLHAQEVQPVGEDAPRAETEAVDATQQPPEEVVGSVPAEAVEAGPANQAPADADGLIPAPPAGKGLIVFFREKKFAGAAVRYKVREGEKELGKLGSGTYFIHEAEPGAHEYTVHSEAKDVLNLEVEAGETYFVIGSVTMGFLAGRPNLSPSDETSFRAMSDDLKLAKPLE